MPIVLSPLRYPGSKQRVIGKIRPYWDAVLNVVHQYREPFLGGASIFFNLEISGKDVWLNDKDSNIATLFKVIQNNPNDLCELVKKITPSIKLWKKIRFSEPESEIDIAFKTLFLNRTNYSGIMNANPIGGYHQKSDYPIYCRWNKKDLTQRILTCSQLLQKAQITSEDFFYVLIKPFRQNIFFMVDPPYFNKSSDLYEEKMSLDDHIRLRDLLANTRHKFLLTYDNCQEVKNLYKDVPGLYYQENGWYYSTGTATENGRSMGRELFISNIKVPGLTQHQIKEQELYSLG